MQKLERYVKILRIWKYTFRKVHHSVRLKKLTKNMSAGDLYLRISHRETVVEVM